MLTEKILAENDRHLRYVRSGMEGPPLVLLHGVARRWQDWIPLLPTLACRWQTIAFDFRGHGSSSRGADAYLLADYLQDALMILRERVTEPAVLFGHSLGALVALGAAACAPAKVRAIVLEDPPSSRLLANFKQSPYHAQFVAMQALSSSTLSVGELTGRLVDVQVPTPRGVVRLGDLRDATSLRFTARCLQQLDPRVLTPIIEQRLVGDINLDEWARQIACPVLLLRGNETLGGMLNKADADAWFRQTHDLTQIDLSNVGHLIHAMDTQMTLRLVTCFLESLR